MIAFPSMKALNIKLDAHDMDRLQRIQRTTELKFSDVIRQLIRIYGEQLAEKLRVEK